MSSATRNVVVFAVVVVVHVALIFALSSIDTRSSGDAQEFHSELIFISEKKSVAKREQQFKRRKEPATTDKVADPRVPPSAAAPVAIPATVWREHAREAAGDVVARNVESDSRRSFSKPNSVAQPRTPKDTVSLFPAPLHKNGDTQLLGDGEIITWVSDKCYATNRPFAAPQLDGSRLNVVCKDPFNARTDLFDHLKPKYLQVSPAQDGDRPVQGASDEATAPTCSYSTFRCK